MSDKISNLLTIIVRHKSSEIQLSIPLDSRSSIGFEKNGTGTATIKMIEEIVEKVIKLENNKIINIDNGKGSN